MRHCCDPKHTMGDNCFTLFICCLMDTLDFLCTMFPIHYLCSWLSQFNSIIFIRSLFLIWKVQCTIFQKYLKKRVLIFILHYLSLSLKYYEKHFINFIYRWIDLFDVCMIHKQCNLMFLHLSIRNQKYSFNW